MMGSLGSSSAMSSGAHIRNGSCSSELPHDCRCDLWLVSFMIHEGHVDELPVCGISQNQVRVTQGFHVLDFFLVLTCNSFNSTQRLQLLIVPSDPKCGTAVAAMGGVPSKSNADEDDEYHDEVHDSKARWQVFSGEKKDVNKNDLFRGIQCDTWFGVWQFVITKVAFSGMSCLYFFIVSLQLKWSIIYDSLCCSWSRAMTSLNQDFSTICLNKSKKNNNKGKRAQRFINFLCQRPMNWEWWALLSGVWGRASRKPGTYRCTSQAWAFTLRDSHCGYHGAMEKSDFEKEDKYRIL